MKNKETKTVMCPFCGQTRLVTVMTEDGFDYTGHQRGSSYSETEDRGCKCELGQLQHKAENGDITIIPMCVNCKHHKAGCCTNRETIREISTMFNITEPIQIRDTRKSCAHWEFKNELVTRLFTIKEK